MLKNRRRVIILLIILMTSVFLSCGIGVPYTIVATIEYKANTQDSNIGTINISTEEIDSDANITNGPSLVLVYGVSETEIKDATIGDAYLSTVNSGWNSAKLPVVTADTSKLLFTKTIDGTSVDFYLFMPENSKELSDFDYHYNFKNSSFYSGLRIESPSSTAESLTLTIPSLEGKYPIIKLNKVIWRVNPDLSVLRTSTGKKVYFYIFAAITSANSSTNYTTELKWLRSFTYSVTI